MQIESFTHAGLTIEISTEELIESFHDPRQFDGNLSHLYCWHPRHVLGDEQFSRDDHPGRDMADVGRWLEVTRGAVALTPLFLYEHGGLSISAADFSRTIDPGGWDTTAIGYAYTTAERAREIGLELSDLDGIHRAIRDEIATYDAYLKGDVIRWELLDAEGCYLDGCGGYLDERASIEYVRSEARAAATSHAEQLIAA